MLTSAAEDAFQQANMTALLKRDGGVRGIANVVPQVGGEESGEAVQQGSGKSMRSVPVRPFNDVTRALTDDSPTPTVLSVDGIGAYDHVFRGATPPKLLSSRS